MWPGAAFFPDCSRLRCRILLAWRTIHRQLKSALLLTSVIIDWHTNMSTSSEPIAARVTGGTRSLRGSVGSSISEAVSPHQSLRQILAPLSLPTSLTIRQLCDLKVELDHECLRHATDAFLDPGWDATSEVDSLVELAIFLSGSLSQCGHPGTFLFQEIQLRALVSVLALLQHNGVHTLDPDVWDQLKLKNISNRFQKITFQLKPESTLAEKIRYAPNLYLIQLASQYVSYIRRGDSPWPSIFGPAVNIFFGGVAIVNSIFPLFKTVG